MTIRNQVKDLEEILAGWNAGQSEIDAVRRLEIGTKQTPVGERNEGYYSQKALRGFRLLVDAYASLNASLTTSQIRKFARFKQILSQLELEQFPEGRAYPASKRANDKMRELEKNGEVYIVSGHKKHFNIVKISRSRYGYTYTKYDAGHGATYVGYAGNRAIVNAVEERVIAPDADIRGLIEVTIKKKNMLSDSVGYRNAEAVINANLAVNPVRVVEQYGQRKSNCTTRGQRIMLEDMLQDPALSQDVHEFISGIEEFDDLNIKAALQDRIAALKKHPDYAASIDIRSLFKRAWPTLLGMSIPERVARKIDARMHSTTYVRTNKDIDCIVFNGSQRELVDLKKAMARCGIEAVLCKQSNFFKEVDPNNFPPGQPLALRVRSASMKKFNQLIDAYVVSPAVPVRGQRLAGRDFRYT